MCGLVVEFSANVCTFDVFTTNVIATKNANGFKSRLGINNYK